MALSLEDAGRQVSKAAHFLAPDLPDMLHAHGSIARDVELVIPSVAVLEANHALAEWDAAVLESTGHVRDRARLWVSTGDHAAVERLAVALHSLVESVTPEQIAHTWYSHHVPSTTEAVWEFHAAYRVARWKPTPPVSPTEVPARRPHP